MEIERYKEWLLVYAKGLAMGCADAVPGVSGGTIALITGIYERLISAITSIDVEKVVTVARGINPSNLSEAREVFRDLDGFFLMVLMTGILTAVVSVLRAVHYLLTHHPVATYGFFFGLIAVSAAVLYRGIDLSTRATKLSAMTGFLLAFLVSGYATTGLGHGPGILFLSGVIAVSAMVLPGISGSLLLIILGQYEYMTGALSRFTDSVVSGLVAGEAGPVVETSQPVLIFVVGSLVGLFTVAHAVRKALEHHRQATLAFLVSLVAGALRAPVEEVSGALSRQGVSWLTASPEFAAAALLGGLAVYLLDRLGEPISLAGDSGGQDY